MVDFSQFNIDKDALVNALAYNYAESPSTQAYLSTAAANNPDYAQMIGNIARFGDIDRANFNLGMQALAQTNAKKRQDELLAREDKIRKEGQDFQIKMYNKARQDKLADRDYYEQLAMQDMPDIYEIDQGQNWDNTADPQQKAKLNDINKLIGLYTNSNSLLEKKKLAKQINYLKNTTDFSTPTQTVATSPNQVQDDLGVLDKIGIGLMQYVNPNKANQILEERIGNTVSNPVTEGGKKYSIGEKLKNFFTGMDQKAYKVNKLMANNGLTFADWNSNPQNNVIKQQLAINPQIANALGTNDVSKLQIMDNPSMPNVKYIVNTETNNVYALQIDNNGQILQVLDVNED